MSFTRKCVSFFKHPIPKQSKDKFSLLFALTGNTINNFTNRKKPQNVTQCFLCVERYDILLQSHESRALQNYLLAVIKSLLYKTKKPSTTTSQLTKQNILKWTKGVNFHFNQNNFVIRGLLYIIIAPIRWYLPVDLPFWLLTSSLLHNIRHPTRYIRHHQYTTLFLFPTQINLQNATRGSKTWKKETK